MAVPSDAQGWADALDPQEYKEYVFSWSSVNTANGGATIVSATVEMYSEAVAAGIQIVQTSVGDNTHEIWVNVTTSNQTDAAFDGSGTAYGFLFTMYDSGGRTLQRSATLTVRQR